MYGKLFTLILAVFGLCLTSYAQDTQSTGSGWGGLFPSEALVINDNFMGYDFFHSDAAPDEGNSNNSIDPVSSEVVYGYTNRVFDVPFIGAEATKATYDCYQCAFAPEWSTAYAYKNATESTPNVSDGFVEVSRDYGSNPGEIAGYFIVDLRELAFVEIIQWTHSSCGGNKRGVLVEISLDDSLTWDTLRYQPGENWAASFTRDPGTGVDTENEYRCDPSAYGMVWEDGIWSENVMLRFKVAGGQVPRIHDLKVYGIVTDPGTPSSAEDINKNLLKIYSYDKMVRISEPANVNVYNITGKLVKTVENSNVVAMNDLTKGVYIVKAQAGTRLKTTKVFVK